MVPVDFANGICSTALGSENGVEVFNFGTPFSVGSLLTFGEHERLAGVEKSVNSGEAAVGRSDLEDTRKTKQIEGCSTCFEDYFVRKHKK